MITENTDTHAILNGWPPINDRPIDEFAEIEAESDARQACASSTPPYMITTLLEKIDARFNQLAEIIPGNADLHSRLNELNKVRRMINDLAKTSKAESRNKA